MKAFSPSLLALGLTLTASSGYLLFAQEPMSQVKSYSQGKATEPPIIRSASTPDLSEGGSAFKAPQAISEDQAIFKKDYSIIYTAGSRWPIPYAIDVCWVNPEATSKEMVDDLQAWVSSEYKKAGLGFLWGGKCTDFSRSYQIRVYIARVFNWTGQEVSAGSGLSWIGPVNAPLGGTDGPGTMRIDVAKDVLGYPTNGMRDWLRETTRAMVVHEFGHALGLAHEQERSDAPVCQDQRGTLPNGGGYLFVGQYDPTSIMNYCKIGPNASSLSEGDITGLKTLYPPRSTEPVGAPKNNYAIRSRATNNCLNVPSGSQKPNVMLTQAACNQGLEQGFTTEASGDNWIIRSASSNLCLDIPGSTKDNGARVQQFTCNGTKAQQWKLETRGGGWVSMKNVGSGKCLGIELRKGIPQQFTCGFEAYKAFGFFSVKGSMPVSTRLTR